MFRSPDLLFSPHYRSSTAVYRQNYSQLRHLCVIKRITVRYYVRDREIKLTNSIFKRSRQKFQKSHYIAIDFADCSFCIRRVVVN